GPCQTGRLGGVRRQARADTARAARRPRTPVAGEGMRARRREIACAELRMARLDPKPLLARTGALSNQRLGVKPLHLGPLNLGSLRLELRPAAAARCSAACRGPR